MIEDSSIWKSISEKVDVSELVQSYYNPCNFQLELRDIIVEYAKVMKNPIVIEVGSSFGITSALLPEDYDITLLDIDEIALAKAKQAYSIIGKTVSVLNEDMFKMDNIHTTYDIAFNAGVLEHFTFKQRREIILNMSLVLKQTGLLVIAVPNHCSLPYRVGYLYSNIFKKWMYPKEHKIANLTKEIQQIKCLELVKEFTIDKENIYNYLPKYLNFCFRKLDRLFKYQSYLKVFVLRKGKK